MAIVLGENRYGKSSVRVMKVLRDANEHRVTEWTVEVWLEGDFQACFDHGDNSRLLPTDTMKNTVYSLARASKARSIEDFAKEVAGYLITTNLYAELAGVRIQAVPWKQVQVDGERFLTAFMHGGDCINTTTVTHSRLGGSKVVSGFENIWLLKTAKSAFAGFLRDRLTTLKETQDRLFGTLARVEWTYASANLDFEELRKEIVGTLLRTFAEHESLSVQQTLFAMAGNALERVDALREVHVFMPNKHCNLVDLSAFGQDNPNEIFVPTDEPHGSIEARVRRGA